MLESRLCHRLSIARQIPLELMKKSTVPVRSKKAEKVKGSEKALLKNGIDPNNLSKCACHHLAKITKLSSAQLQEKYELPCGCEEASLKDLLDDYECAGCGGVYFYSFCWG